MWVLAKHCEEWGFYIIHFNIFFFFLLHLVNGHTINNLQFMHIQKRLASA